MLLLNFLLNNLLVNIIATNSVVLITLWLWVQNLNCV